MNNLRTSPLSSCKNLPLLFHGAFAPPFIWRRRPWLSSCTTTVQAVRSLNERRTQLTDNPRDADDKVHLVLVGDCGEICVHLLTLSTSCRLISLSRRHVEVAVCTAVVLPTGCTQCHNITRLRYALYTYVTKRLKPAGVLGGQNQRLIMFRLLIA